MPVGSFSTFVSGFTSDHTYQTATAVSYANNGASLTLRGMTWNLLNKGAAKSTERKANNPFDIDELEQYYVLRKGNQLRFLWHQIKSDNFDFIVLQEVDMFMRDPLPDYVKEFLEKIRAKGWFHVHTDKSDEMRTALLTFYDTKKLRFISKRSLLPVAASSRKTAFEATFAYLGTNAEVCITNVHLDLNTDHRQEILEYQKKQIADGKFTLIGGDANHTPDKEHYGLVGDLNMPTNISNPLNGEEPTDAGGKILQRLDGFMVGPANPAARVEITEGPGAYFTWVPTNFLMKSIQRKKEAEAAMGNYACRTFDPVKEHTGHMVHISSPGLPWIRDKYKHLILGQA